MRVDILNMARAAVRLSNTDRVTKVFLHLGNGQTLGVSKLRLEGFTLISASPISPVMILVEDLRGVGVTLAKADREVSIPELIAELDAEAERAKADAVKRTAA